MKPGRRGACAASATALARCTAGAGSSKTRWLLAEDTSVAPTDSDGDVGGGSVTSGSMERGVAAAAAWALSLVLGAELRGADDGRGCRAVTPAVASAVAPSGGGLGRAGGSGTHVACSRASQSSGLVPSTCARPNQPQQGVAEQILLVHPTTPPPQHIPPLPALQHIPPNQHHSTTHQDRAMTG